GGVLRACESACEILFLLSAELSELPALIRTVHEKGKKLFLHVDLCEGLGKDACGVRYVGSLGVDGIISTRTGLIKAARECGVRCVQRFFMVDSRSVDTALEAIRTARPDMIEIMPAIATKTITRLARTVSVPIIAGGLLEEKKEIFAALSAGASAVSTGSVALWDFE
ncbi:MAG: glycerol-3-phosphate responsive antiterminator, partial [Clostridia bacterium]|nr:glycerol-3-phosphate responsive antiterminator [Clostridia bacterium]